MFRSKVVVVSGDDKQMPPTSFFSCKVENDEAALFDGEEPEDDGVRRGARRVRRDLEPPRDKGLSRSPAPGARRASDADASGPLSVRIPRTHRVLERIVLRQPAERSSPASRRRRPSHTPIEVVRSDGLYKNQTNIKEAADVVEYLTDLWTKSAPPSVGVVTFNRKQADIIEEALEERAEDDRAFRDALMRERERMEDGEDMGFFVKNVENVQGDERDVVVFSSTFGRTNRQTFRKNFGVLGQAGGERRLNVAVTRARKKVVLMTSMPIGDISEMHTTRRPARNPSGLSAGVYGVRTHGLRRMHMRSAGRCSSVS